MRVNLNLAAAKFFKFNFKHRACRLSPTLSPKPELVSDSESEASTF